MNLVCREDISNWVETWGKNKTKGLTKETSYALQQTCSSTAELAAYLLQSKNFTYVLPGKALSDRLEKRFSWYRQSCGGNFFISVRQVLEAEKCIKMLMLSKFSPSAFTEFTQQNDEDVNSYFIALHADNLLESLNEDPSLQCEDPHDLNLIYYLAGYVAKSLKSSLTCDSCKECLIASNNEPSNICQDERKCQGIGDGDNWSTKNHLYEVLNRGGLISPSDQCFLSCLMIYNFFNKLMANQGTRKNVLEERYSRRIFCEAFTNLPSPEMKIFDKTCRKQHHFKPVLHKICFKMFNILMKNMVLKTNEEEMLKRKRPYNGSKDPQKRKISKLQSETNS